MFEAIVRESQNEDQNWAHILYTSPITHSNDWNYMNIVASATVPD